MFENKVGEVVQLTQVTCPMNSDGKLECFQNYCYNCGSFVKDQKYCKNCGSKLDWKNKNNFQKHLYDWVYKNMEDNVYAYKIVDGLKVNVRNFVYKELLQNLAITSKFNMKAKRLNRWRYSIYFKEK